MIDSVDQQFTTYDRDNDLLARNNCAVKYSGAWWHKSCHLANLNGLYLYGVEDPPLAESVVWEPWRGFSYSMKSTEMKMRPVGSNPV